MSVLDLSEIRLLLRRLRNTHPAPDLDRKVVEMLLEWHRQEGQDQSQQATERGPRAGGAGRLEG